MTSAHAETISSPKTITPFRPFSEFDSGLNTSAAWTEHLEQNDGSSADEEDLQLKQARPARALYDFEGKPEFRELTVQAGDALTILNEHLSDGWSLAKYKGEAGLIPHAYYTFTAEFTFLNDLAEESSSGRRREASNDTITPDHPSSLIDGLPLIPQSTGEWFSNLPNLKRSIFRGKSLNRFTSFVTSGAEDWILNGNTTEHEPSHEKETSIDADGLENHLQEHNSKALSGEADYHFIEVGPTWKSKVPPFSVLVHSPSKRTSTITGAYTLYTITSVFGNLPNEGEAEHSLSIVSDKQMRVTVYRRYSQFVFLHSALTRRLPGIALPPLPEKQYTGRFNDEFVEARRGDLQRYLNKIVRHPIARYAEVTTFFLSCENDIEWKRQLPNHTLNPGGSAFYARVYHPAFNFDVDDAVEIADRFENHIKAVDKGIQGLRNMYGKVRSARAEMSSAERLLSYNLLSIITSTPLAGAAMSNTDENDDEDSESPSSRKSKLKGLANHDGAWCWKEECNDCLRLTKATQRASEILQGIADLYDDYARRTMFNTHETIKDLSHPSTIYAPIIDTHKSTLSRYKDALADPSVGEEVTSRCETVLNTTMAEFETYHTQKMEDFEGLVKDHLDNEISFYEKVLAKLRAAREVFDSPYTELLTKDPRVPSVFERDLPNPELISPPLPQPCAHVYDAGPMKPVTNAIQDGVGILLRSSSNFGQNKLW